MDRSGGESKAKSVGTLIFLDTESTDLPRYSEKPKITELCMIAVTRKHFLESTTLPRVKNVMSFCVNPKTLIAPRAAEITRLSNENLADQKEFSTRIAQLVCDFVHMNSLGTVCILAHNGDRFDFPLLKAELKCSKARLPEGVLCADTLKAFKHIDKCETEGMDVSDENCTVGMYNAEIPLTDSDLLIPEEVVMGDNSDFNDVNSNFETFRLNHEVNAGKENWAMAEGDHIEPIVIRPIDYTKDKIVQQNEVTPHRKRLSEKDCKSVVATLPKCIHLDDAYFTPIRSNVAKVETVSQKPFAHRRVCLFPEQQHNESSNCLLGIQPIATGKKSFCLESLYKRLVGPLKQPMHAAEDDAMALLQICIKKKDLFIKWVDDNASPLTNTRPMWN